MYRNMLFAFFPFIVLSHFRRRLDIFEKRTSRCVGIAQTFVMNNVLKYLEVQQIEIYPHAYYLLSTKRIVFLYSMV